MSDIVTLADGLCDDDMDESRRITACEWDDWNKTHIGKHHVSEIEVEEVVFGVSLVRESYKNRLQLIGPTSIGRMLTVVVGFVPGRVTAVYVFSARPASRKERRRYAGWRSNHQNATNG